MTGRLQASEVSARVQTLIARHHNGDSRAAASWLGMDPDRLAGLLSGDWTQFSLDDLAVLVRRYSISAAWLITGRDRWH